MGEVCLDEGNERVPAPRGNATTDFPARAAFRGQLYCLGGAKRAKIAPQTSGIRGMSDKSFPAAARLQWEVISETP